MSTCLTSSEGWYKDNNRALELYPLEQYMSLHCSFVSVADVKIPRDVKI